MILKLTSNSDAQNRKTLDLESRTEKLTDFFAQVLQHDIPIPGQNQSPSSEVDTNMVNCTENTTLITSESKYADGRITEVSQAGSSSTLSHC